VDSAQAGRLLELAARHPYGDWRLVIHALERVLATREEALDLAERMLEWIGEARIGDLDERFARADAAIAHRYPNLALEHAKLHVKDPHRLALVLAAVSISRSGQERSDLVSSAVDLARRSESAWRSLEATASIARLIVSELPIKAAELSDHVAGEAHLLDRSYLTAVALAGAADVRLALGDHDVAVKWLDEACRFLATSPGGDDAYALDVIASILREAPSEIFDRVLPGLLEALQTTDDLILREIETVIELVLRVAPGPLRPYLDQLKLAEAAVAASFVP
jgi:hypothetical protein